MLLTGKLFAGSIRILTGGSQRLLHLKRREVYLVRRKTPSS